MTNSESKKDSRFAYVWGIGAGLLLISTCIAAGIYYFNFTLFDCSNDRVSYSASGDRKIVANIVRRDCGATTDFVTFVYLKEAPPKKAADADWGDEIYAVEGITDVSVRWADSGIKIAAPSSGRRVVLKRDEWNGIKIVYEYL